MTDPQTAELFEELKHFQAEKEKIRMIIGQVGGRQSAARQKTITTVFLVVLALLFIADVCRHLLHLSVPLPPLFSIEIGVLLVSIKIILMIHNQSRVEHFQFWILNSIEFRVDQISKRMGEIERRLREGVAAEQIASPPVQG